MPVVTTNVTSSSLEVAKIAIQVLGYAVTWGIVFVGWRVNNSQNKRRDERKELRDQIGSIIDAVREVESNVVTYLTEQGGESKDASYWTVYFGVHQVNSSVVLCKLFDTPEIGKRLRSYRQAITDKAMPGPTSVLPTGTQLNSVLRTVSAAGNGLVRELETRYRELYPLSSSSRLS